MAPGRRQGGLEGRGLGISRAWVPSSAGSPPQSRLGTQASLSSPGGPVQAGSSASLTSGVQSSLAAGRAEGQLLPPWTVRLSVEGAPCGPVNADCLAPSHARHPYLRETGALHLVYPQAPLQQELIS